MEELNRNWWSWALRIIHFEINTGTQIPRKGEVTNLNKDYPGKKGKTSALMVVKKVLFSLLPSRVRFMWWLLSKWKTQAFVKAVSSFFPTGNVRYMYGQWQIDMQLTVFLLHMWSKSGKLEHSQREEFPAASSVSEVLCVVLEQHQKLKNKHFFSEILCTACFCGDIWHVKCYSEWGNTWLEDLIK